MALNRRAGCAKTGVLRRKTPVFALKVPQKNRADLGRKIRGAFFTPILASVLFARSLRVFFHVVLRVFT